MEKILNVLRGSGGAEGGGKVFAGLMAIGGAVGAVSVGSQAFYTGVLLIIRTAVGRAHRAWLRQFLEVIESWFTTGMRVLTWK